MLKVFDVRDVGQYADGSFGHNHVRARLHDLVAPYLDQEHSADDKALAYSLLNDMPGDAWDEEEALDILNLNSVDVVWQLVGGSLVLEAEEVELNGNHENCIHKRESTEHADPGN